jgi:hypothetical protein
MIVKDLEAALLYFYDNRDDYKPFNTIFNYLNTIKPFTKIEVQLIIQKLVKDGYIIEEEQEIVHFQSASDRTYTTKTFRWFITYDGILFVNAPVKEYIDRPYDYFLDNLKRKEKSARIENWPKKFWWLIAIATFFFGFISDIGKEVFRRKILQESIQSAPLAPQMSDTLKKNF